MKRRYLVSLVLLTAVAVSLALSVNYARARWSLRQGWAYSVAKTCTDGIIVTEFVKTDDGGTFENYISKKFNTGVDVFEVENSEKNR